MVQAARERNRNTEDDDIGREQGKVGSNCLLAPRLPDYKNLYNEM